MDFITDMAVGLNCIKKEIILKTQEQAIQYMRDFIEGRVSTEDFWTTYKSSELLQELLINDEKRPIEVRDCDFAPKNLLKAIDISKLQHKYQLWEAVWGYFHFREEKLKSKNSDAEKYLNLQKMLPAWLDIREEDLLLGIYNSAPNNLTKADKLNYCKDKVKEIFKFDNKPPRWVQNPEWPIVNGKPLVFRNQSKEAPDDQRVFFYFYNPDTKEETIIEQLY